MVKAKILNLIFKNSIKLFNRKDEVYRNNKLKSFLIENNIFLPIDCITVQKVYNYLNNINKIPVCETCFKKLEFKGFWKKRAYNKSCSNKCKQIRLGKMHMGKNNTAFRMSIETRKKWKNKLSNSLKKSIKEGKFIPNITNSWCKSRCEIIINNKIVKTRSTWEAFFYIVNNHLKYEKIIIPYNFNGIERCYIVDFVDEKNKILYEIKPDSLKNNLLVKTKIKYAKKWCKKNKYQFQIISNDWFYENFKKHKNLILNQPSSDKIYKNLNQFNNEN